MWQDILVYFLVDGMIAGVGTFLWVRGGSGWARGIGMAMVVLYAMTVIVAFLEFETVTVGDAIAYVCALIAAIIGAIGGRLFRQRLPAARPV